MSQTGSPMEQKQRWYSPIVAFFRPIHRVWKHIVQPHPFLQDPQNQWKARLLAALSLLLGISALSGLLYNTIANRTAGDSQKIQVLMIAIAVVSAITYTVSRTRYYRAGITIIIASLSLLTYAGALIGDPSARTFAMLVLPLMFIMSTAYVSLRGMVSLSLGNAVISMLMPVVAPNIGWEFAATIAGQSMVYGALLGMITFTRERIERERLDEVSNMNQDLRVLTSDMEQRVADRTKDIAVAAEVGRRIAVVRDLNEMLFEAVELVRKYFNLYYSQIYLLDSTGRTLVVRAGTGETGREMLRRSHRLMVDVSSVNGSAAVERRPVVVTDTTKSASFLAHPMLPDTRSEIAFPLIVGDRLLGVLDLQSSIPGALKQEDLPVFEILAGQIATALLNAELFEQLQRSLEELEVRSRQSAGQGWASYMDAVEVGERVAYTFDQTSVAPLQEPLPAVQDDCVLNAPIEVAGQRLGQFQFAGEQNWSRDDAEMVNQVASQVAQQIENLRLLNQANRYQREAQKALRRLTREEWEGYLTEEISGAMAFAYQDGMVKPVPADQNGHANLRQYEIKVQDQPIGTMDVPGADGLTPEDEELIAAINEHLGEHLENMRLYTAAQLELQERKRAEERLARRAAELAMVADTATVVATIASAEEMLQTVVDLVKDNFNLYHAHVYMLNEDGDMLELAKGAGTVGRQMVAEGRSIPLNLEQSLVARAARSREGVIVNDVRQNPDFLPHPLLPQTRSEMAVPMIAGDRLLGVLDIQAEEVERFNEEDIAIQTTLASQVAIALQNARQYEQTQESEQLIRTVIDSTPDWIFVKDREFRFRLVNKGFADAAQMAAEDIIGKTAVEIGGPAELAYGDPEKGIVGFNAIDQEVMDSGKSRIIDNDIEMIDGKPHIFNTLKTPLRDANGNIWGVLAFSRDVTEREEMLQEMSKQQLLLQQELAERQRTEEALSGALRAARMGYWELDLASMTFTFNDEFYAMLRTTAEEQGGYQLSVDQYAEKFAHPDDMALVGEETMKAIQTTDPNYQKQLEHRFYYANGEMGYLSVTITVVKDEQGNTIKTRGANQDITERKRAAMALEAQQQQLQQELVERQRTEEALSGTLRAARMGYWELDLASMTFTFNDEFYAMLRTTAEEQGGYQLSVDQYAEKFAHPDDMALVGEETMKAIQTTDPNYQKQLEHRFYYADGEMGYLSVTITVVKDEQGNTIKTRGANQDITERKRAAMALEAQQRTLQVILDSMPVAVLAKDAKNFQFVMWNEMAESLFGIPKETIVGKTDYDFYPKEQADAFRAADEEVLAKRALVDIPEEQANNSSGETRYLHTVKVPVINDANEPELLLVVTEDITDRKHSQEIIAKRAVELAMVAEVSTRVSTIQTPDEMLQTVVDLTKQSFGLYHAHIYLLNDTGDALVLAKGAGDVGRKMVAEGREIGLNVAKSLVARAARSRSGVIANDVYADPDFLSHPLLPETRSEMAVPMIAGDRLVGIIDIQDEERNRFTAEDVNIMTTLAAQVAVSLQNARSYARAQRQAEREALINAISERIQATNSVETALQVAVREIGRALGAPHASIRLGLERKNNDQ